MSDISYKHVQVSNGKATLCLLVYINNRMLYTNSNYFEKAADTLKEQMVSRRNEIKSVTTK